MSSLKINQDKGFVSLGAQYGDQRAGAALEPLRQKLRVALTRCLGKPYSSSISEVAFILRVDGTVWHWEMSGVHRVRLQKKQGYVTADIHFAKEDYVNVSDRDLTAQLLEYVNEAAKLCVERVRKAKLDFDSESFFADMENAAQEVRSSLSSPGGQ